MPEKCDKKGIIKDSKLAKDDGKSLDSLIALRKTACGQPEIAQAVVEVVLQGVWMSEHPSFGLSGLLTLMQRNVHSYEMFYH